MFDAPNINPVSWYLKCEMDINRPSHLSCYYRVGETIWAVFWTKYGVSKHIALPTDKTNNHIILWDGNREWHSNITYTFVIYGEPTFDEAFKKITQKHKGLINNPDYRKRKWGTPADRYPFCTEKWFMKHFNSPEMKKLTEEFCLNNATDILPI